jgi:peptidoglycan glycosyltransferase
MLRRFKKLSRKRKLILVALILFSLFTRNLWMGPAAKLLAFKPKILKEDIASAMAESNLSHQLPSQLVLDLKGRIEKVQVQYSFDETLQREMTELFQTYKPDYGAFVAIDANTGRVLSLVSYNAEDPWIKDHLALRATFPSASVFKVVTAAAAISERKLSAGSILSYNGRPHTLYRKNIFSENVNRWTSHLTLKEAFAKSVNTVFGRLGVYIVGPSELRDYADRFGFNRHIVSDIPFQQGKAEITEDPWEIAETASGYTLTNTMSPLQGALIGAAVANDGKMMEPFVVESLRDEDGDLVYQSKPQLSVDVFNAGTAKELKELMRETVRAGTSRTSFKNFGRGSYSFVDVGGKTGSLTGKDPAGKYDWFVGYGTAGEHRIAFATLTISKEFWKVKSALLSRKALEIYFKEKFGLQTVADRRIASREKRKNVAVRKIKNTRKRNR